jgi:hypothetical protein
MPKGKPGRLASVNPLTPEEAARLAYDLLDFDDGRRVAQLLLLVHAFTYCDPADRENLASEIEERLLPWLDGADDFRHAAMRRELEAIKKGGAK